MSDQYTPSIGTLFDAWNLWRGPFLTRKNWFPDTKSLREVTDAELERTLAAFKRDAEIALLERLSDKYAGFVKSDDPLSRLTFSTTSKLLAEEANELRKEQTDDRR